MTLTKDQLDLCAEDIFYLAHQLFTLYSWRTAVEPELANLSTLRERTEIKLVQNCIVESHGMFCRKLNEVFLKSNSHFPGDLKCEMFGYTATGGFLSRAEIDELDKRFAHPTTRQAVHGKQAHRIYELTHKALNHAIPFFKFLSANYYAADVARSQHYRSVVDKLRQLWNEWSSSVSDPKDRKTLSV